MEKYPVVGFLIFRFSNRYSRTPLILLTKLSVKLVKWIEISELFLKRQIRKLIFSLNTYLVMSIQLKRIGTIYYKL